MREFEHKIGDPVIVDVRGRIIARHENERGLKYLIMPLDKGLPVVHAHPDFVFPDDEPEPLSNVVAFPREVA